MLQPPRYINPRIAELKKQIELEHQIRDGGAKLLQASKTSKQSMEASKGLFVSEAKIIGHMRELQQIQGKSEGHPSATWSVYLAKLCVLHYSSFVLVLTRNCHEVEGE